MATPLWTLPSGIAATAAAGGGGRGRDRGRQTGQGAAAAAAAVVAAATTVATAAATRTHHQSGFFITTRRLPISCAGAIETLTGRLGIPLPEMIFGENAVEVRHERSGWALRFDAALALDAVDKSGRGMLQVAHARAWAGSRAAATAAGVARPYDWSYSTPYRGTVVGAGSLGGSGRVGAGAEDTDAGTNDADAGTADADAGAGGSRGGRFDFAPVLTPIPVELLMRRDDPILFFDDVLLYESELDDNGISVLSVKVRVHAARMLLLSRLFMRLDGVLIRLRDTRVYVDFSAQRLIREYTAREAPFDAVRTKLVMSGRLPDDVTVSLRDPNVLAPLLPIVEQQLEGVDLSELT